MRMLNTKIFNLFFQFFLQFSLGWVYQVLDHKKEEERIIYEVEGLSRNLKGQFFEFFRILKGEIANSKLISVESLIILSL